MITQAEILEALKQMTIDERVAIIEAAARTIREDAEQKALRRAEQKRQWAEATKEAAPDYMPGGPLYDLWSPDSEPYFDSEEEFLEALHGKVKADA